MSIHNGYGEKTMGLIKCRECGNPVSTKAPLCPTCGAPAKKRMGCVTVVLGCTIGFVILGIILPAIRGDSSTKPTSSRSASNNIDPIVAASVPLPPVIPKPPAFDIRKISPAEMPKRAVLTLEQSFPIANGKGSAKAMPGAEVAILALDGELVEAAYLNGKAKIPYRNTNIEDQITKARLDEWRRKNQLAAQEHQERIRVAQAEKQLADERVARSKLIKAQFSGWDGSHINLTAYIKKSMNDPDSYKHEETVYWDREDHLLVSATFRGKNAFGGLVKNSVTAKVNLDGVVLEIVE
jgi:hypothetical protein